MPITTAFIPPIRIAPDNARLLNWIKQRELRAKCTARLTPLSERATVAHQIRAFAHSVVVRLKIGGEVVAEEG